MSNKRKLTTILAVAGATVLAAGGSAFVINTGLSMIDRDTVTEQGSDVATSEKETELPLTVEKFAATKDSFTVKPQSTTKKNDQKTTEKTGESDQQETTVSESTDTASSSGSDSQSSSTSGDTSASGSDTGSASTDFSSSQYYSKDGKFYNESEGGYYDEKGLYHDQWGGYYSADGAYYDGQGGYWDGDGYHGSGSGSSSGSSSSGSSSSGGSSSGGNSSGITIDDGSGNAGGSSSGGGNSGAYDDSYMMYDIDSRYVSEDELSGWSSEDLAKLRNEIFARHGRIFTTQKWINYFATKTWYVPRYENVDALLNDYEWANLEVIMKLEDERY